MSGYVKVDRHRCDGCGTCVAVCPAGAITLPDAVVEIEQDRCDLCLNCLVICPVKAVSFDAGSPVAGRGLGDG